MKSNPDNCKQNSTTRNISAFIAQVVRESPLHEAGVSSRKKARTVPKALALGGSCNSERRRSGRKLGRQFVHRHSVDLFSTPRKQLDEISEILPRLRRLSSEESHSQTPNRSVTRFINQINQAQCEIGSPLETVFPIPPPPPPPASSKSVSTRLNFFDMYDSCNTSISDYIGKVIERSPRKQNRTLRTGKDSVGDWIMSAMNNTSPPQARDTGHLQKRKRNRKLVSEGFAEYVRLLSRRLANDVHLWYHSVKRDAHLDGIERDSIITATVDSIRIHGCLYITSCTLGDPIPENIAENEHYMSHCKVTIMFTHQTVVMLRITKKSCVKICPPWTFLPVGQQGSPVILCTYFSFLGYSTPQHTHQPVETDQLTKNTAVTSLWRSVGSQDVRYSASSGSGVLQSDESTMDADLCLREYSLASVLRSQRWEDLTLAGRIVHVTQSVNPTDTESVDIPYFHTFIQDVSGHISMLTLQERLLDKFPSVQHAYQLMNNSMIFNSVRIVSRVSKLKSPHVMSVVQALSAENQCYCYCLAANTNVKLSIFRQSMTHDDTHTTTLLSRLSSEEDLTNEKRKRFSLVGRLLHTQIETSLRRKESENGENNRTPTGVYIFLLGANSQLFQVFIDPILTQVLLTELNQSIGKLFYLTSLYRCPVTHRPTRLQGDQFSLLTELDQAGGWLGTDLIESLRDRFDQILPPPFPPFDHNYRMWSMVRVKGRIVDVVEESAFVWQVCDRCEEGVDEYSQSTELYCDECQRSVTQPIDKYNLDIIVKCTGVENTELIIQLHHAFTIKKIMPQHGTGKVYEKIELKGKEIELDSCFIQECSTLPTGITKVFLEENIQF